MDLMDALLGRRSVRSYKDKPVPKDVVFTLIKAAKTAPSAGNLRARRYLIVTNPQIRKALALASYGQNHVKTAPLLIVICADIPRSAGRYGDRASLYSIQDSAAATMCILLAAHDLGLGACWNGAFDDQLVRDILDLSKDVLPTAIISIGWPDEIPQSPSPGSSDEVVSWIE